MLRHAIFAAALAVLCVPLALSEKNDKQQGNTNQNENQAQPGNANPNPVNIPDQHKASGKEEMANLTPQTFLNKLHEDNQMEIKMGELAQKRGANEEVKKYGQMLVQDHQKADQQVMEAAKAQNITLSAPMKDLRAQAGKEKQPAEPAQPANPQATPQEKDAKGHHGDAYQKLSQLSGAEFDKEFAACMVKDHQKALSLLDQPNQQGDLAPVKDLADKLRPTIQQHEQKAIQIAKQVGAVAQTARAVSDNAKSKSANNAPKNANSNPSATPKPDATPK